MKVVYVAGPYRGANAWEIERNIRRAEEEAFKVWEMGAAAVCPHANTRYFQGTLPDQVWLDGDLAILRLCDAVYVVPNWEASTGTKIEIEQAKRWDIPVFYDIDALDEWLQLELEAL